VPVGESSDLTQFAHKNLSEMVQVFRYPASLSRDDKGSARAWQTGFLERVFITTFHR